MSSDRLGSGSRFWRAMSVALVIGTILVGGLYLVARQTESPAQDAARSDAPPHSAVMVEVRQGALETTERFPCSIVAGAEKRFTLEVHPDYADRSIVTRMPVGRGAAVREGQVLLELSGRPVFVISGVLPPYRDLRRGDHGPDVMQLQAALVRRDHLGASAMSGILDSTTVEAIGEFYRDLGYDAPGTVTTALGAEGAPFDPGSSGEQGVNAEAPVWLADEYIVIERPGQRVYFPDLAVGVDALDKSLLLRSGTLQAACELSGDLQINRKGDAGLVLGDKILPVRKVGQPEQKGRADDQPGEALPQTRVAPWGGTPLPRNLALGDLVDLEFLTRHAKGRGLLVPVSALWTDNDGTTTVRVGRDDVREVTVRIVATAEGTAMVTSVTGFLSRGDWVQVSSAR